MALGLTQLWKKNWTNITQLPNRPPSWELGIAPAGRITHASYQDEPDSYEAEDFSEPVVIPHQGEPAQPFPADKSSNTRRLSTIIAALMFPGNLLLL